MRTPHITVPSVIALAVLLGLGACSKQIDGPTTGAKVDAGIAKVEQKTDAAVTKLEQKTDAAVAKVEQKTDQAMAAVKSGVDSAGTGSANVMGAAKAKLTDATITTSINAELARDPGLSALKINVDTTAGRVALHGTAPDAAARERATLLAQRIDGVVGVDNQLVIKSN